MVSIDDILRAARRKLIASPYFSPLIGVDVGVDTMDPGRYSGAFSDAWVFRGVGVPNSPERDPSGTGKATVSIGVRDRWGGANDHNTARFPVLQFVVIADMTRPTDDNGLIGARDAELRCDRVASAIRAEFHDAANQHHWWTDDVFINTCLCLTDLSIRDVENMDGLVRGDIRFKLEVM